MPKDNQPPRSQPRCLSNAVMKLERNHSLVKKARVSPALMNLKKKLEKDICLLHRRGDLLLEDTTLSKSMKTVYCAVVFYPVSSPVEVLQQTFALRWRELCLLLSISTLNKSCAKLNKDTTLSEAIKLWTQEGVSDGQAKFVGEFQVVHAVTRTRLIEINESSIELSKKSGTISLAPVKNEAQLQRLLDGFAQFTSFSEQNFSRHESTSTIKNSS